MRTWTPEEREEMRRHFTTRGTNASGEVVWGSGSRLGVPPQDNEDHPRDLPDPEGWDLP